MKEQAKHDWVLCKEGVCVCSCRKCRDCREPKTGMAGRRDTMMRKTDRVHTKGNGNTRK